MKIKQEIIERINGRADLKRALLEALDISQPTLWRALQNNEENGILTTFKSLKVISDHLGIAPEECLIENQDNVK